MADSDELLTALKELADRVEATNECDHKRIACEDIGCIGAVVVRARKAITKATESVVQVPPTGSHVHWSEDGNATADGDTGAENSTKQSCGAAPHVPGCLLFDWDSRTNDPKPSCTCRLDAVCQHGTAMDVHCCHCHSGFIFDMAHECPSRTHELKTWLGNFVAVESGAKTFEVRRDDRRFQVGDELLLRAWCPVTSTYLGPEVTVCVSYVLREYPALASGYVVLGLSDNRMVTRKANSELLAIALLELWQELRPQDSDEWLRDARELAKEIASGNQAMKEHADSTRRSEAP